MCGVIWRRYQVPVTGGNMDAGEGRLDFELPQWDSEDKPAVEEELNAELQARLPVEVSFLPREEADQDGQTGGQVPGPAQGRGGHHQAGDARR